MGVSKKTRFEIFKRDKFTCVYCGNQPPECVLELEHIQPRSNGGTDEDSNLATSCFDCNRGKGARELSVIDCDNTAMIQIETLAQLTAFNKMLVSSVAAQSEIAAEAVSYILEAWGWESYMICEARIASIKRFLKSLNFAELCDAANVASQKRGAKARWSYFCGVCWTKIRRAQQ